MRSPRLGRPSFERIKTGTGFTLIELLVVITIIVVLLSLLAPALDRAIEQAGMAVCGANLDGLAHGANMYTLSNRRAYPYRPTVEGRFPTPHNVFYRGSIDPSRTANSKPQEDTDDRPYLVDFGWDFFVDPLSGDIDIRPEETSEETAFVYSNYALWFGRRYPGYSGMNRMGDRLKTNADGAEVAFQALASDMDQVTPNANVSAFSSHPDVGPRSMDLTVFYNEGGTPPTPNKYMMSRWNGRNGANMPRSTVSTNFAFTDGSVRNYANVAWDAYKEGRMARVPTAAFNNNVVNGWVNLPAN